MTGQAGVGDVHREGVRTGVVGGTDIMRAVAILAENGDGRRPVLGIAMNAVADLSIGLVVAGRAIDRLELRSVGEVRQLFKVGVAVDASDSRRAVGRSGETRAVHEKGKAPVRLQPGVPMAGQAVVVRWAAEGRRSRPEEGQRRREGQPQERVAKPHQVLNPRRRRMMAGMKKTRVRAVRMKTVQTRIFLT